MSRTRHLAAIRAALDRAISSPSSVNDDMIRIVGSVIIERGRFVERFDRDDWTPSRVRRAVLAYAEQAPCLVLTEMAAIARKKIRWVEWWEIAGHDEGEIGYNATLLLPEREARKVAALERAS